MKNVVVTGGFDDIRSKHVRFLDEASRLGDLSVILWPDEEIQRLSGSPPKFSQQERMYFLESLRYVQQVKLTPGRVAPHDLPFAADLDPDLWVVDQDQDHYDKRIYCASNGLGYRVLHHSEMQGWPRPAAPDKPPTERRPKVIVTGCYDWLHSGHIRFFEEASAYGESVCCGRS